ncbi:hypothetical protein BHM03_00027878 [Ensete ventricosum]|nr:hypothetical protein BHM03_00027878 [Ensete ventricosum]
MERASPTPPPRSSTTSIQLQTPGHRDQATSSLFDWHELRTIISLVSHALTPRWTPNHRKTQSSNLYDSFELKAAVNQIDRTLHAAQHGCSPYPSPNLLKKFYRKKGKKLRQVAEPEPGSGHTSSSHAGQSRGIVPKIWKKLKRAFRRRRSA